MISKYYQVCKQAITQDPIYRSCFPLLGWRREGRCADRGLDLDLIERIQDSPPDIQQVINKFVSREPLHGVLNPLPAFAVQNRICFYIEKVHLLICLCSLTSYLYTLSIGVIDETSSI